MTKVIWEVELKVTAAQVLCLEITLVVIRGCINQDKLNDAKPTVNLLTGMIKS